MELVKIFIAGEVFCMFDEVLWAKTGLGVAKILMVCIAAGVALDVVGILGPIIGFRQEGFTVTIYGAGTSIFDGVMGSVRDHGLSGIIRLTNFYFLRLPGLIVCTMAVATVLGFLFPGTRGKQHIIGGKQRGCRYQKLKTAAFDMWRPASRRGRRFRTADPPVPFRHLHLHSPSAGWLSCVRPMALSLCCWSFIGSFKQAYHTTPSKYRTSLEGISDTENRAESRKAEFFKDRAGDLR